MIKNDFAARAVRAEAEGWDEERLRNLLGKKREMAGIFQGDDVDGKMEAGQSSGLVKEILTVEQVFNKLIGEYQQAIARQNKAEVSN